MKPSAKRASFLSLGNSGLISQGVVLATISAAVFWLVWLYGNGLRDTQFLDGWMLAGGMALQVYFHFAIKRSLLSPKSATKWRQIHIYTGYLLVAFFFSHTGFSLPDSGIEWALWSGFMLITLSGIFGTYLSWSVKTKGRIEDRMVYERIPARRAEIAREVHGIVASANTGASAIALPTLPYNEWINDLYANQLRSFLKGPRNYGSHFIGSLRSGKRLADEIENLQRYVDKSGEDKLMAIKTLVLEKDRLDFAHVHLGLMKIWLFVHVPVTYSMVLLIVLHILVGYSFSSGVW